MYYQVWLSCGDDQDDVRPRPDWEALPPERQRKDEQGASQCVGMWVRGCLRGNIGSRRPTASTELH